MGGSWFIVIARQAIKGAVEALAAGVPTLGSPINLLSLCSPTIMEEWQLTAISAPLSFIAKEGGEIPVGTVPTVEATLTLRRGGDIVWSKTIDEPLTSTEGHWFKNVTISEDFVNPVSVKRGQTLTLELAFSFNFSTNTQEALVSEQVTNTGEPRKVINAEGTVQYDSKTETGHRVL